MISATISPSSFVWRWVLALALILSCLNGSRASAAGDPTVLRSPGTMHVSQPATPALWAAWTDGVLGNRNRMIQVATVVIVIGIFILSRSTK